MRLIDADKLPWVDRVILVDNVDVGDIVIKVAPNYTSYVNDETPTVEAIPIEWIKKWLDKNTELETVSVDGVWDIQKLMKDWEKENEKG